MNNINALRTRRIAAALGICASLALGLVQPVSAQATTSVAGLIASQPTAPAKIESCKAIVSGTSFTPQIVFDQASPVKSSTVTYAFFDKSNASLGQIALTPPYDAHPLPAGFDTFTCAITRELLADGTVFPPPAASNNTALIIGGLAGVGLIAALAGHGGSSSTPTQTAIPTVTPTPTQVVTPSPSPSPTPTPIVTATPSPIVTATPTPAITPTPTATPTVGPSSKPTATASPTATATATATASPTATATAAATASPTASPTVNPSAPVLSVNPVDISGSGNTGQTTVSETNYSGTFTTMSTCGSGGSPQPGQTAGPIAAISPMAPYANPSTITVTAKEAGSCTVTFTDSNNLSVTLMIGVTTSTVGINVKKPVAKPRTVAPAPTPVSGVAPGIRPARR